MFKNLKINTKLVAVFLLVGLIPLGVMSFYAVSKSKAALEKQAFNQLVSLCKVKKTQVESYFHERMSDVQALAGNPIVVEAVQDLEDAMLSEGANSSDFQQADELYSDWLERYKKEFGYANLYLVSADGNVVYSIDKGPDFATNLIDGRFSSENIGDLFRQARHGTAIVDIAGYTPINGAAASFVGAPIRDGGGDLVGEVILQIPLEQLNKIMQESSGLGESGETYLVGKDLMMRSDSRFSSRPTMLKQKIETSTCQKGLAGETGVDVVSGQNGRQILSAYAPLTVGDVQWCLMAEIDESEALAGVSSLQVSLIIAVGVLAVFLFVVGWFFARSISRPIIQIAEVARNVSTGDLHQRLNIHSQDELGELAGSFRELIEYMKSLADAAEKIANNDLTVSIEPRSDKDILGLSFKTMLTNLVAVIRQLGEAAGQLVSAATEISTSSERMSQGANSQAHQVSQVATAIEQMSSTVIESARNAGDATDTSKSAADTAMVGGQIVNDSIQGMQRIADTVRSSAESIAKLAMSADQIGEIVGVIDDIADQTNLLALNAAIEAARAGEQGRGFAVVADEVRKLAERTTKATGEITDMIKGIQNETEEAVNSMEAGVQEVDKGRELADRAGASLNEIVTMSKQVMEMVQQIATATDQQSVSVDEISSNIEMVSTITKETAAGAEQSATAAEELNRQADALRGMTDRFKVQKDSSDT